MDWTNDYSCKWRLRRVDPFTWLDGEDAPPLMAADISRDGTDDVPLLESGGFDVDGELQRGWYRLSAIVTQDGAAGLVNVATMLLESGDESLVRRAPWTRYDGRSVLQPAADRIIDAGTYVPAGADCAGRAASLLRACTPAPVTALGSFTLAENYVFDPGSTHLECAWALLNAAGWCMRVTPMGEVQVGPKPTGAAVTIDSSSASQIAPDATRKLDWSQVPNRYRAVDGDQEAYALNDLVDSPCSVQAAGRVIDAKPLDSSPQRVDGETLAAYARRKLAEASTVMREFTYTREYAPGVVPFDIVHADLAAFGMEGDMRVLSQTLHCGAGIYVEERAGIEVRGFE